MNTAERNSAPGALVRAGGVFGFGMGGFIDGIVLHQILQWHHLVSSQYLPDTVANLQINTLWDGIFHLTSWIVTAIGAVWIARAAWQTGGPIPWRSLAGGMVMGWGAFNLVEGLIDHYLLGIHHVRPGPNQAWYDLAFLILSVVLLGAGWWMARSGENQPRRV